jgi:dihydrofolate reductase
MTCPVCFQDKCQVCTMAGIWNMSAIVAMTRDGLLSVSGRLPWACPADMGRFRALTLGKRVIMGRKTWDSLPHAPLKGRSNLILSRSAHDLPGAQVAREAENLHYGIVIGGAEVYRLLTERCKYLFLTTIPDSLLTSNLTGAKVLFPREVLIDFQDARNLISSVTVDGVLYQTWRHRGR